MVIIRCLVDRQGSGFGLVSVRVGCAWHRAASRRGSALVLRRCVQILRGGSVVDLMSPHRSTRSMTLSAPVSTSTSFGGTPFFSAKIARMFRQYGSGYSRHAVIKSSCRSPAGREQEVKPNIEV
jgi:hypothetical protein